MKRRRRRKKKESSPTPPRCQELHPRSVPVEGPLALEHCPWGRKLSAQGQQRHWFPPGRAGICDSDFSHRSALSVLQHQGSQPEAHPHDGQAAQTQGHCHQIQALVPLPEEEEAKVWGRNDIQLSWVCTQGCVSEATHQTPNSTSLKTPREHRELHLAFREIPAYLCRDFAFVGTRRESGICLWVSPSWKICKTRFLPTWSSHVFSQRGPAHTHQPLHLHQRCLQSHRQMEQESWPYPQTPWAVMTRKSLSLV